MTICAAKLVGCLLAGGITSYCCTLHISCFTFYVDMDALQYQPDLQVCITYSLCCVVPNCAMLCRTVLCCATGLAQARLSQAGLGWAVMMLCCIMLRCAVLQKMVQSYPVMICLNCFPKWHADMPGNKSLNPCCACQPHLAAVPWNAGNIACAVSATDGVHSTTSATGTDAPRACALLLMPLILLPATKAVTAAR